MAKVVDKGPSVGRTDDSLRILGSRCAETELSQLLLSLRRERIQPGVRLAIVSFPCLSKEYLDCKVQLLLSY